MDEGEPPNSLELIETSHIDEGMYVQKKLVDELKRYFMQRDGKLVRDILAHIPAETAHHAQDEAPAAEQEQEQPQSLPEATDEPQAEAPPEKKKKGQTATNRRGVTHLRHRNERCLLGVIGHGEVLSKQKLRRRECIEGEGGKDKPICIVRSVLRSKLSLSPKQIWTQRSKTDPPINEN